MGIATNTFVDVLRQYRLLDAQPLAELTRNLQHRFPDPKVLAKELLRRGWLTPYQVNQLLQDRGRELLLGSYVLLERLGEGGMGQVFKARNSKLGQVVALKVIRPERLTNPETVRRFHREIRLAGQLNHPNIVRALDADEAGGAHLLVMEYVEGTDLGRLVKQSGPLPVGQACDYIRQAALGLQHIHEQGLVHRDIKPSNLIVQTSAGNGRSAATVKILDLGLARLDESAAGEITTDMTVLGCVVGTPDFMAPEQARDSHNADIRSDLYSLGCSLYCLLTGQVPYPGGTGTEKLLQHHMEEPRPVEALRPDVPPGLAAVVRRLMAKRPEDRYQTPAEAAAALATWHNAGRPAAAITTKIPVPTVVRGLARQKLADPASFRRLGATSRRWRVLAAAVLLLLLGGLAASRALFQRRSVPPENSSVARAKDSTTPRTTAASKTSPRDERPDSLPRNVVVLGEARPGAAVYALAISANGQTLVSGGVDNTVHVWDTSKWRERGALRNHTGEVRALAVTADGRLVASGSTDQTIKLWDAATGNEITTLKGHTGTIRALAFSPDGRTLASGADRDVDLRLWDVASRQERAVWKGHEGGVHALSFAASGQVLASAGVDRLIRLWELEANKEGPVLKGHTSDIISLAYAPDGKKIASGTSGGVLRVWNPATQTNHRLKAAKSSVTALAFSPDGQWLLSASAKGAVALWEVDTEDRIQEWTFPAGVHCAAFGPKAQYVAVGTAAGTVQVFRPER